MSSVSPDRGDPDRRPVPDPTVLTTAALAREVAVLREFVLREIRHQQDLADSRFKSIDEKFVDAEKRTAEQKADTKAALDAALQSAERAVGLQTVSSDKSIAKSEATTAKQIDALGVLVDRNSAADAEKFADLKSRVSALEASRAVWVIIGTLGVAVAGIVLAVILRA